LAFLNLLSSRFVSLGVDNPFILRQRELLEHLAGRLN
jgi:hypothetical protein